MNILYSHIILWQIYDSLKKTITELQTAFQSNKRTCFNKQTVSNTDTGTDQNFIIGCRYFLKKCKLPARTKTLLFVAGIFLVVIFLFPWYFSHQSIYLSRDGLIFFCFSLYGALGLLLCLESKKHKRSGSLPSLMENQLKFDLHVYLCHNFWVNG